MITYKIYKIKFRNKIKFKEETTMTVSKIERLDEIPLILHWLTTMHIAEIIDNIWPSHGNWQGK